MTPADELPNISESELEVLRELWDRGPQTVRQLHVALEGEDRGRAYNTVQTLLYRLEEKGYVTADRAGSAHIFSQSVSRDSLLGRRLEELASKLCDGAAGPPRLEFGRTRQVQHRGNRALSPTTRRPRSTLRQ